MNKISNLKKFVIQRRRSHQDQPKEMMVKITDREDFTCIAASVEKFRTSSRITDRTRRGDVCVVGYKQGALACVRWAALTPLELPEFGNVLLNLASDEAYVYDAYTLPSFRRQGFTVYTGILLVNYLAEQGVRTIYRMTQTNNVVTCNNRRQRMQEGIQRTIGTITVVTLLGVQRHKFYANSIGDGRTMTRLFQLPLNTIRVQPLESQILASEIVKIS